MSGGIIQVSSEKLEHARISLAAIPGGAQRAVKSALHRVGDGLKTDAVKETKQRYHLLPGEIRKHLRWRLRRHTGLPGIPNIIETVRQELLTTRYLGRKYKLEIPFKWYLFEEQPWPVFFGQIETVWETGRPVMTGIGKFIGKE
jgi:hypothetical protein